MFSFHPLFLAILALHTSSSLTAPTTTSAPSETATPAPKSPNDQIYKNLAAAGHLDWIPTPGGGKVATIPKEHWNAASNKVSQRSDPSASLFRRDSGGDIEGLITDLSCYGRGAVAQDSEIQDFAIQACNALVGANVPKPVQNALKVWQSTDFADVNGIQGYLRYSFEILNNVSEMPDVKMCTAAMDMFTALCQASNGATQGGENTVGKDYKFNVDPTDDYNNY